MKARLYIENKEVELDENVLFAITKTFEDLQDPAVILNDWSKTVKIPFTKKNNDLFGGLFNEDRQTAYSASETELTGIYFDPLKKLDFRLDYGDNTVMIGYVKVNSVTKQNGKGSYNITLNGELGKILQDIKKITFLNAEEDKYLIDGTKYVDEHINKELVNECWTSTGQSTLELYEKEDPKYKFTDIIGFAANNAFSDGFDYKTIQSGSSTRAQIQDITTEAAGDFETVNNILPSAIVENGVSPRTIGEFRSYKQLPYIYFNKLVKIFLKKAEELSGYKIDLDESWFNDLNPYWKDLVMMLENKPSTKEIDAHNDYGLYDHYKWVYRTSPGRDGDYNFTTASQPAKNFMIIRPAIFKEEFAIYKASTRTFETEALKDYKASINNKMYLKVYPPDIPITAEKIRFSSDAGILVDYVVEDVSTGVLNIVCTYLLCRNYDVDWAFRLKQLNVTATGIVDYPEMEYEDDAWLLRATLDGSVNIPDGTTKSVVLKYRFYSVGKYADLNTYAMFEAKYAGQDWKTATAEDTEDLVYRVDYYDGNLRFDFKLDNARSGTHLTLDRMWNSKQTIFDVILSYCKMFRITLVVDTYTKTLKFIPVSKIFKDYKILDYTSKVDKSKDFVIKPVSWEDKYILFNSEDNKSSLGTSYKAKYGVNFGDRRLVTDYNFNTKTKNLFKGINTPIISNQNIFDWEAFVSTSGGRRMTVKNYNEPYIVSWDDSNKEISVFGQFLFFDGLLKFGKDNWPIYITDDTAMQRTSKKFTYVHSNISAPTGSYLNVTAYPKITNRIKGGISGEYEIFNTFNIPMEDYLVDSTPIEDRKTIYDYVWSNYIEERYNYSNKIVTCYLDIRPDDFSAFLFNNFIMILNQLYMINKIYDYDISTNGSTKVDLITILNPEAYHKTIWEDYMKGIALYKVGDLSFSGSVKKERDVMYAKSSTDLTFEDGTKEATDAGVRFKIYEQDNMIGTTTYNYVITAEPVSKYVLPIKTRKTMDLSNGAVKNAFNFERYKDVINNTSSSSTILNPNEAQFKISVESIEKPKDVTLEIAGDGQIFLVGDWINEGDNIWTMNYNVISSEDLDVTASIKTFSDDVVKAPIRILRKTTEDDLDAQEDNDNASDE